MLCVFVRSDFVLRHRTAVPLWLGTQARGGGGREEEEKGEGQGQGEGQEGQKVITCVDYLC